jgi:hypothetical protein
MDRLDGQARFAVEAPAYSVTHIVLSR